MIYEDCSVSGYEYGDFIVLGRSPNYYNKICIQCKKCKSIYEITLHNKATIKDLKGVCKNCQIKEYVESLVNKSFANFKILRFIPKEDKKFYTDCDLEVQCTNCGKTDIMSLEYVKNYIIKKKTKSNNKYCKNCYNVKDKTVDILKSKKDTKHCKWDLPRNVTFCKQTGNLRAYVKIGDSHYTTDTLSLKKAMEFVSYNKLINNIWTQADVDSYMSTYKKYKNISLGNRYLFDIRQDRKRKRLNIEKAKRIAKRDLIRKRIIHILEKFSEKSIYSLGMKEIENAYVDIYKSKNIDSKKFQNNLRAFLKSYIDKIFIKVNSYPTKFGLCKYNDKIDKKTKYITLDGTVFKTQRELADFLRISKQRVNQIVKKHGYNLFSDENGKIKSI